MQNLESCTGATGLKGINGKELAEFRVFQEGGFDYYARQMDADQRVESKR